MIHSGESLFDWLNKLPRYTPHDEFVVRLKRGNAIPVLAKSPTGEEYVYNSIRIFTQDTVGLSKRSTAQRRVAKGGGDVGGWYIKSLK